MTVKKSLLVLLLLPLAILCVYWPGVGGGFVFDDFPNIVDNKALHVSGLLWTDWVAAIFSSPASDLQRPLAMLSFAINHYFTGLAPEPMKLTNIAIHALNSLLVFGLARRVKDGIGAAAWTRDSDWTAAFVAACWALHPINLMAVLLIVQRMEILSHTFVFLGLWLFVVGRQRQLSGQTGWSMVLGGLIPFTAAGMLAKESAALLPLYAFVLELCLFKFRGPIDRDKRLYWLFAAVLFLPASLAVAWLLPRSLQPWAFDSRTYGMAERLLTEPRVILDYLRWMLAPDLSQLSLYHDDYLPSRSLWSPPATLLGLLAVPSLIALAWMTRRARPLASLGIAWFLAAHVLTGTFLPLELMFEHRNYFASLGICLVLADLLLLAPRHSSQGRLCVLLAASFLLVMAGLTHLRAREWSHPVMFSLTEATKHPSSPRATYDLARTLIVLGDYNQASPYTRDAWPALEAARLAPGSGILPASAALMLAARSGSPERAEWWREITRKLETRPIGPQEVAAIGSLVVCVRRSLCGFQPETMLGLFAAALSRGTHPEILNIYADYALNVLGDPELALRLWDEAIAIRPQEPQYQTNRTKLLKALGRNDGAPSSSSPVRQQ